MSVVNLGVDLGGTALRAAYGHGVEAAGHFEVRGKRWPWLLCEPPARPGMAAAFPSLKSRLGITDTVRVEGVAVDPVAVLAAALSEIRDRVVKETDSRLGHTAIGVPARFSSRQRGALLRAAEQAGLPEVSLVSDSIATVIAHAGPEATGTYLVFGMGYTGFELGLVRAARGRYRAMGYDGAASPGGGLFDTRVLQSLLDALAGQRVAIEDQLGGESGWHLLRETAAEIKERSAAGDPRTFLSRIGLRRTSVYFSQEVFDEDIRRVATGSLERAGAVLEEAGLEAEDITALLLTGGSSRMPIMGALAEATGLPVERAGPMSLELGALRYASQLASRSSAVADEAPEPEAEDSPEPAVQAPPLPATLLTSPEEAAAAPDKASGDALDKARQLLQKGRLDEAEKTAREVMTEAEAVLRDIVARRTGAVPEPDPDRAPGPTGDAERLRARARKFFELGEFKEAIHVMHIAWERDDGGSELFAEMVQMHCDAAMTRPTIANFKRQEAWLKCAISHDAGNARIFDLLAERCFLHAQALNRTNRKTEARETLGDALRWNPEHEGAIALLRQLKPR
ncbi:Hsp70 family protein [Glycomyces buryatensis]|uniref:Hsp70 family protein n=1 Tax=Glycomyces buryatensis TaxID=2570927 RepID=A0A4S8Q6B2_9ACTN|nr:Hsp70 family protein [Glycomyces buryatensis]THV39833.1 hypothetical protein FAB82_16625 [Glycomyces buryatensis]